MNSKADSAGGSRRRLHDTHARLEELEETLRAIRRGEADAVVVSTPDGDRVFTLQGADHPYRVMVEAISEGAATLTVSGQILYANRRLAEMVGTELENMTGSRLHDVVQTRDCPTLDEMLERALSAPQKEECILQGAAGKMLPVYLSMSALKGLELQAICMIATDLTEHKRRQAELAHTNELFKAEIAERKRAEAALRRLTGRLFRLQDEERRRIARDLHDSTAQTLNSLVLNLAYLQDGGDKEGARTAPKLIAECMTLAEQAAEEIRNLSHLLYPPALDQMGLITAIQWHTARTAEVSGIRISLDLPSEMTRLPREVEVALFRVLQESLENVRRHSGSPVASVCLVRREDEVRLEVKDQGRGVPADLLASSDPNGAGLGMAGMQERLRQLGGRLEVHSGDAGTSVAAIVPLGEAKHSNRPRRSGLPVRVLIVDDSAAVRGGVRALLEGDPHLEFVGEAANGREAIERAIELRPDIVLLDIAMPEMDGLEATRRMRAVTPHVRVLALSQDESSRTAERAREAGALGYVLKSDAAQDLVPAVRAVSQGKTFLSATIARRLERA